MLDHTRLLANIQSVFVSCHVLGNSCWSQDILCGEIMVTSGKTLVAADFVLSWLLSCTPCQYCCCILRWCMQVASNSRSLNLEHLWISLDVILQGSTTCVHSHSCLFLFPNEFTCLSLPFSSCTVHFDCCWGHCCEDLLLSKFSHLYS
jgi:hypothetical protein